MASLLYVSSDDPGFYRKGRGKGYEYFQDKGQKLTDKNDLQRINQLRIPPAWKNVWVCTNPEGHLQTTGIDAKGRKQYLYHEGWNRQSHIDKFDRMAGFARALPQIRKKMQLALRKQGWPLEKVVSLLISILDQTSIRIGNKSYEQLYRTYGLTTLRKKHMKVNGDAISFQFKAKSGVQSHTIIKGKRLTRLILECSELPGYEVFQFLDDEGKPRPVFSNDVNAYLQEISGSNYSAKDFRTWGGTVWAVELYPDALADFKIAPKRSLISCLVKRVAEKLGNTMAVCKAHYIHPVMLALAESKELDVDKILDKASTKYEDLKTDLSKYELTALCLIEKSS